MNENTSLVRANVNSIVFYRVLSLIYAKLTSSVMEYTRRPEIKITRNKKS